MSLRDKVGSGSECGGRWLWGRTTGVRLDDLLCGTTLRGRLPELAGRSVLVATHDQLAAALALIELDGLAGRLVVGTPGLTAEHVSAVVAKAGVDAIVSDRDPEDGGDFGVPLYVKCGPVIARGDRAEATPRATEWVLLTSGTTGAPKMPVHTFASLTAPIKSGQHQERDVVWGTFYDIRRYGGLQIFLRAILGRGSFVLSSGDESAGDYLGRLRQHAVTHVSGTPSHWRRALMSPAVRAISPRYVRLSGEIADQAILSALRAAYPQASVGHAYASTEAGVGFEVDDGLEGFPASTIGASGPVEMKIEDGSLRIRSPRTAGRYLGEDAPVLVDREGFVDTGDVVELRGGRYYFLGRKSGMINVGGLKIYPEEIETIINRHPAVRVSVVRSRKSPITGSLVVAEVVLKGEPDVVNVRREIMTLCNENLASHKIPATLRFVPTLDVGAAGKLARPSA